METKTKIYVSYITTYDDYGNAIHFSADYFITREKAEAYAKARVKTWINTLQIKYEVKEVVIGVGEGYGIDFDGPDNLNNVFYRRG